MRNPAGEFVALADVLADVPAIVHPWATWCASCREELPALDCFLRSLTPLIARWVPPLSVDTRPQSVLAAFLGELEATTVAPWQWLDGTAALAFRPTRFPTTLLPASTATLWPVSPARWTGTIRPCARFATHLSGG